MISVPCLKLPGMYAALHGFLFAHALTIHWPRSCPLTLSRCPMTELMPFTCGLIESRSGPMPLKIATTLIPALIDSSVGLTSTAPLTGVITNASNLCDTIASCICLICLFWSKPASNCVTVAPALFADSLMPRYWDAVKAFATIGLKNARRTCSWLPPALTPAVSAATMQTAITAPRPPSAQNAFGTFALLSLRR